MGNLTSSNKVSLSQILSVTGTSPNFSNLVQNGKGSKQVSEIGSNYADYNNKLFNSNTSLKITLPKDADFTTFFFYSSSLSGTVQISTDNGVTYNSFDITSNNSTTKSKGTKSQCYVIIVKNNTVALVDKKLPLKNIVDLITIKGQKSPLTTLTSNLGNTIEPMTDLGLGCECNKYMFLLIIIFIVYIVYNYYNKNLNLY